METSSHFIGAVGLFHVLINYSGLRVDGTDPNVGGLYGPLYKGHLGVCAIEPLKPL